MKNPTTKILGQAVKMAEDGKTMKAIIAETGLNLSQAWCAVRAHQLKDEGLLLSLEEVTAVKVADLRSEGLSWGEIGVRCQVPESRVRKLYAEKTGMKSQGNRIGKGGRFYYGVSGEPLYSHGLKKTGTAIPVGAHLGEALEAAKGQQLIHLDMAELKAMAADYGVSVPAKATKAGVVTKIRKEMNKVSA